MTMKLKTFAPSAGLAAGFAALLALGAAGPAEASPMVRLFMYKADLNGDGILTRAEARNLRQGRFGQIDRNANGVLDPGDVDLVQNASRAERLGKFLEVQDANGDGIVTREEFAKGPMPVFDIADKNNDNALTGAEIEAFVAAASAAAQ